MSPPSNEAGELRARWAEMLEHPAQATLADALSALLSEALEDARSSLLTSNDDEGRCQSIRVLLRDALLHQRLHLRLHLRETTGFPYADELRRRLTARAADPHDSPSDAQAPTDEDDAAPLDERILRSIGGEGALDAARDALDEAAWVIGLPPASVSTIA